MAGEMRTGSNPLLAAVAALGFTIDTVEWLLVSINIIRCRRLDVMDNRHWIGKPLYTAAIYP